MFNIQSIPGWRFVVFMTVMYLLWESTFTMNDIGYWAMLPSLSSVKEERNSITTLTVLFAGVGAIPRRASFRRSPAATSARATASSPS
jgi:hypothetical protein